MIDDSLISADFDQLMRQAHSTAGLYLREARSEIDREFGEGFAKENPSLVAAFMQTAATDMSTATIAKVFGVTHHRIAQGLTAIADVIESM